MASYTANLVKQVCAFLRNRTASELGITGRCFRRSHETRKMIDIGEAVRPWCVVRFCRRVTQFCNLIRLHAVRDTHLIEISVSGERQQTRVLILPAETTPRHLSGRLYDGHLENLSADFMM